jgi:hypothetical protein
MPNMLRFMRLAAGALVPALVVPFVAASAPSAQRPQDPDRIMDRVWVRTRPAEPAGSFRVFLANGTAMTGSCTETYRLDRWRMNSATRLTITEDGTAIPADVAFAGRELRLRLHLVRGGVREERYRPAAVPFLCPEGPRGR